MEQQHEILAGERLSLIPTGLMVWPGTGRGLSLEAFNDEIVVVCGADRERVNADVGTLVESLACRGLIGAAK